MRIASSTSDHKPGLMNSCSTEASRVHPLRPTSRAGTPAPCDPRATPRHPRGDAEHAERAMPNIPSVATNGGNFSFVTSSPVHETAHPADQHTRGDRQQAVHRRHACAVRPVHLSVNPYRHYRDERHDRADGEVDAAADEYEQHPQPHDGGDGSLMQQHAQVPAAEERAQFALEADQHREEQQHPGEPDPRSGRKGDGTGEQQIRRESSTWRCSGLKASGGGEQGEPPVAWRHAVGRDTPWFEGERGVSPSCAARSEVPWLEEGADGRERPTGNRGLTPPARLLRHLHHQRLRPELAIRALAAGGHDERPFHRLNPRFGVQHHLAARFTFRDQNAVQPDVQYPHTVR